MADAERTVRSQTRIHAEPKRTESPPRQKGLKRGGTALEQLSIPFDLTGWTDSRYVIPTMLLQTAIFGVPLKKGVPRPRYMRELLAHENEVGFELHFTGQALDQFDEDAYLGLIRNAKHRGLGARIPVTLRGLLRDMGLDSCGDLGTRLKASFDRLFEAQIEITIKGKGKYKGHLVESISTDDALISDNYVFRLNPDMARLFAADSRTILESSARQQLKYGPAKWLHTVIEACVEDHIIISMTTLWKRSGSQNKDVKDFRTKLNKALVELKNLKFVVSYRFEGDLVIIQRAPSSPNGSAKAVSSTEFLDGTAY